MGLFDKKYCDICGEKIGLLGNRKLEDGNLCKNCARKLSPFFSERRHSTVEEIKQQLAYREENAHKLTDFYPNMTFGERKKVYIDSDNARFVVTSLTNWRDANPDLIAFDSVKNILTDIRESRKEIYCKDENGNSKSYNPRRYECEYAFNVTLSVDSPWFDEIKLELSEGNRPDSRYTDLYRHYEAQMHSLVSALNGSRNHGTVEKTEEPKTREQEIMEKVIKDATWICRSCDFINHGTLVCQNCGGPVSDEKLLGIARNIAQATLMMENAEKNSEEKQAVCPDCGYEAKNAKFCPACGKPLS